MSVLLTTISGPHSAVLGAYVRAATAHHLATGATPRVVAAGDLFGMTSSLSDKATVALQTVATTIVIGYILHTLFKHGLALGKLVMAIVVGGVVLFGVFNIDSLKTATKKTYDSGVNGLAPLHATPPAVPVTGSNGPLQLVLPGQASGAV